MRALAGGRARSAVARARCETLGVGALAAAASRVAFDASALAKWREALRAARRPSWLEKCGSAGAALIRNQVFF